MTKKTDATKDLPERPLSPYLLWLQDNIEALKKKHPKFSVTQMADHAVKLWEKQPDKVKATYTQRGLTARVKFAVEMLGHMKKIGTDGAKKASATKTKASAERKPESKTKKVKKTSAKPKTPAKSVSKAPSKPTESKTANKALVKAEKPKKIVAAKSQVATKAKAQNKQVKKIVQEKAKKIAKATAKVQEAKKAFEAPSVTKQTKQVAAPVKPVNVAKKTALPAKSSRKSK